MDQDKEIQEKLELGEGPKLHIGGKEVKEGWKILNAQEKEGVDYVQDIRDLSDFHDNQFIAIYASHILEHLGYQNDLKKVLSDIYRILKPGGKFFVSVPDLDTLCQIFVHPQANLDIRYDVMRILYGGQLDKYDFHYVGFNAEILVYFLNRAGFHDIYRVPEFGFFNDTSSLRLGENLISLNVIATK